MHKAANRTATLAAPIVENILALSDDELPGFFHRQMVERQLSLTIRALNSEVLAKEDLRASRAEAALARLGLVSGA